MLLDQIILYVFVSEIVFKILGEGMQPELYFIGPNWAWNNFDFLIVIFSLPLIPTGGGGSIAFLRLIRLMRLAKLFRKVPQLQMIITGLIGGMKSIVYIVILLFLVFYLYAIIGIFFFRLNDPWHFRSVEVTLLTLFATATLSVILNLFFEKRI
jgi:voltage-gated sodium channel